MSKLLLFIGGILVLGFCAFFVDLWYNIFIKGRLYETADVFQVVLYASFPVLLIIGLYLGVKQVKKYISLVFILAVSLIGLSGCSNYAHSSVQTVVTKDCGQTWEVIAPGQAIPRAGLNWCFRTVSIPDYPMQGESKFKVNFKNNVKANAEVDYDYSIVEPIAFLSEAKYVGQQSASEDKKANDSGFETAENGVIDKRIKDIVKGLTPSEDIVDFDVTTFETDLLPKVNEVLKAKGVQLRFLTFVISTDVQTNQAIDAASAMRIYQANGIGELGTEMMKARAGASQVSVTNVPSAKEVNKED